MKFITCLASLASLSALAAAKPYTASLYSGTHCNGEFIGSVDNSNNRCVPLRIVDAHRNAASIQISSEETDHTYTFWEGSGCNDKKLVTVKGNACAQIYKHGTADYVTRHG